MAKLRFDRNFEAPVADVFVALLRMLALRRWDPGVNALSEIVPPRPGTRYSRQTTTALREGRVIEVIRPVSVTLRETLHDPPCRVQLKQRWRIDTVAAATRLQVELDYRLNQAASFRQFHWRFRLDLHCRRMLDHVAANLTQGG